MKLERWTTRILAGLGQFQLWTLFAMLLSISVGIVLAAISDHDNAYPDRKRQQRLGNKPVDRPIANSVDGYVSSEQCRSCHDEQFSTWHASHHRTMTQVPTPESVIADFDDHVLQREGNEFRFFRRGEDYFMSARKLPREGENDSSVAKEFRIVLSTGAHHQQSFWFATDKRRTLGKIPFIWITAEQRWVPYGSIFMKPPTRLSMHAGVWNSTCIKCHVVSGKPRYSRAEGYDSEVAEFGISCEACHGPGEKHIAFHQNEDYSSTEKDPILLNPADLPHDRSSQTCGQCHAVFDVLDLKGVQQLNIDGFPFRPGDDLFDTRHVYQVGEDPNLPVVKRKLSRNPEFYQSQYWSDGMVRVTGREYNGMLETPCYQWGKMSCISCHDMHPDLTDETAKKEWADDQLVPEMHGNAACLQCHQEYRDQTTLTKHTHHEAESTGSNCYNCHMPHTTLGLMKASRSHTVDSPNVSTTLATGRPNACNLCHLDRTLDWTAKHLKEWYNKPVPELMDEQKTVASSILWLLKGDAGQRAIVGWHMGWKPAQDASGTDWMAPFAAELLEDSYEVVRFIGFHSLRKLPKFADFEFDFVATAERRNADHARALEIWRKQETRPQPLETVLIDSTGRLSSELFKRIREERTDPKVILIE
jgi:hypothetical protein